MNTTFIKGIVLNIYEKDNSEALIKALLEDRIVFIKAKGFFKNNSKNLSRVSIGSLVSFEILEKYSHNNSLMMSRAEDELFLKPNHDLKNIKKLFQIFQLIETKSKIIFNEYINFLNSEQLNLEYFLTFLLSKVIETKGLKLEFTKCQICKSNQNLMGFNIYEGGMLCKNHYIENSIKNLNFLKAIFSLGINFDEYKKNTNDLINENIYNEFFKLIEY